MVLVGRVQKTSHLGSKCVSHRLLAILAIHFIKLSQIGENVRKEKFPRYNVHATKQSLECEE